MKTLVAFFLAVSAFASNAADCKLKNSIPFTGSLLQNQGRYFGSLKTSEVPKFLRPENYNPNRDKLAMFMFEIINNGSRSGMAGMKLGIPRKPDFLGFSNEYSGATDIQGGIETVAGVKYYWTRYTIRYAGSIIDAITELRMGVVNKKIVSIEITHPVFELVGSQPPYTYTQFIDENQTFCVTEARFE